jgi:uncharacterized protein
MRQFDWDPAKNESNIAKHGVGFETAKHIFDGPVLTFVDDRKSYGEMRTCSLGKVGDSVVLVVIHTERSGKTRIISARPANRVERKRYEEALSKRTQS